MTFSRFFRACWLWLLVGLLVPTALANAQQTPLTISTQAGYDGSYPVGEWFPLRITVANSGPDLQGVLEWRFASQSRGEFRQSIELARGSRKQITLYVSGTDFSRNGQVVVSSNGVELATHDVRLEPIDSSQLLIGVVSSDPTLLNSLNSFTAPNFNTAVVKHFDLAALPEQPQALRGVRVLFLHDVDTSSLNAAQQQALALWVQFGGQLVVSGGSNASQTAAAVADLLPVEVGDSFGQQSLRSLLQPRQSRTGLPDEATVNQVTPRQGAQGLFNSGNGGPLLFQQVIGNGRVTFSTFDLAQLRGWQGEVELWQDIATPTLRQSVGSASHQGQLPLLDQSLRLEELAILPLPVLFLVLVLYILAVGPVNYLLLRRFNRLEWAWLSIPLVVFGFVGSIYLAGQLLRGNRTEVKQITIVEGTVGRSEALFTSYNGLFSPSRSRYSFGYDPGTLVQPLRGFDDFGDEPRGLVVNTGSRSEVQDVLVNIGEFRTVLSESSGDAGVLVSSNVNESVGRVKGEFRYEQGEPLADAVVVRGRAMQTLGQIEAGQSYTIDFSTNNSDFPYTLDLDAQQDIDRTQMLTQLSNLSEFNQGFIDPSGVYLMGWRNQATVPLQINNTDAAPQGVTLYVIRLR